jgi:hypothetical protein
MIIHTLWHAGDDGDMPWLVTAVDEHTVNECGFPSEYLKKRADPLVRELIVDIPAAPVRALFGAPVVKATVVGD